MASRLLVVWFLLLVACRQKAGEKGSRLIPGYNLSDPVVIHLRSDLDEISGLQYYPKDSSIFAVSDEHGILYKIYLRKKIVIRSWKFSDDADYEDLVLKDTTFYALQSNGILTAFSFSTRRPLSIETCTLPIEGRNDFESIYFDDYYGKIVMVCKDCERDGRKKITAFNYNPDDKTFSKKALYEIDVDRIKDILKNQKVKFKPSAAAVHPLTKELYLLSSVSSTIAIADRDGNIKEAFRLDNKIFTQPEGLTFTPSGDMIISNESAGIGAANILIFKYKPSVHEKD